MMIEREALAGHICCAVNIADPANIDLPETGDRARGRIGFSRAKPSPAMDTLGLTESISRGHEPPKQGEVLGVAFTLASKPASFGVRNRTDNRRLKQ